MLIHSIAWRQITKDAGQDIPVNKSTPPLVESMIETLNSDQLGNPYPGTLSPQLYTSCPISCINILVEYWPQASTFPGSTMSQSSSISEISHCFIFIHHFPDYRSPSFHNLRSWFTLIENVRAFLLCKPYHWSHKITHRSTIDNLSAYYL